MRHFRRFTIREEHLGKEAKRRFREKWERQETGEGDVSAMKIATGGDPERDEIDRRIYYELTGKKISEADYSDDSSDDDSDNNSVTEPLSNLVASHIDDDDNDVYSEHFTSVHHLIND